MTDKLSNLIATIKQTPVLRSNPEFLSAFKSFEKFAENDKELAYMVGSFFKNKFDSDNLPHDIKNRLIRTIKDKRLEDYYYLKIKPQEDGRLVAITLITLSISAMIVGILQLRSGGVWTGINLRYLTFVVDDGRFKLLTGLVFFLLGIFKFRRETIKNRFINQLAEQKSAPNSGLPKPSDTQL